MIATVTELRHWTELKKRLDPEHRQRKTHPFCSVLDQVPRIKCAAGFSMSVQASMFHYCEPQDDCGPWSEVEIGYPSAEESMLLPYAEEPEKPTDTVYGYVPFGTVADIIQKHGGLI